MIETALAFVGTATAVAFINKISGAVSWYTAPRQIIRVAEAEAEAELIRAKSKAESENVELFDLIKRAEFRSTVEQIEQQMNLEKIMLKTLFRLSEDAHPENMDDDWIRNHFDRCRNVSDEDMQELWAKILAGEANNPGSFSRKAVNLMADLENKTATIFSTYCRFIGAIGPKGVPLIVVDDSHRLFEIYEKEGINLTTLRVLADLGLISTGFNPATFLIHQRLEGVPNPVIFSYGGQSMELSCPEGTITTGITILTSAGAELASIGTPGVPVSGFFDFICAQWKNLCEIKPTMTGGGGVLQYG